MLLAIDTSSLVLSCALAEKDRLVAEWTVQKRLTHSEQLIPHLDAMMKEAGVSKEDITAIAVSIGPGSFTGLRIGLATAKMAAYIWKVPIVGVDTLESLARNMEGAEAFILPLEDAQRGHVYAALYGAFDEFWKEAPEEAAPIDDVIAAALRHGGPVIAVGECADTYKEKLESAGIRVAAPHSRLARAGSVARAAWARLEKENRMIRSPFFRITFAAVRQRSYGKTAREILIREAEEKDVSAIYDIGCLCFSDAWRKETVHHDLMENEHSFYLVAEEDGFITGYGCFWFIAGEAQLVNIGVRPCCRRQGIGRMLLQKGIEEARSHGMQTMFLEVRVSNLSAQKMYETFGFKNLGLRKKVYELPIEDGYVMERAL